ncbi:MAG: 5-formyltetrahydrofolate cyclo-ligase [Candidatus Planktophila sp.]|nr:5-formyltetrahydrofolate cyclo-ligase [Candidatus Planktophila sp.]
MNQSTVKKELRERLRRERSQKFIPSNFNIILKSPEIVAASTIASYFSYGVEPSTTEINQALLKAGKRLLLPRINGEVLEWIEWSGDESQLKVTKNLSEPIGEAVSNLDGIDVMVVPALHIDQHGYRLGQGGGYYDRALAYLPGWKIGLVHVGELSSQDLPRAPHDIALDAAATPSIIVRFVH